MSPKIQYAFVDYIVNSFDDCHLAVIAFVLENSWLMRLVFN